MVFLIQTDLPGWQMASAMSHAIHKIVSKNAANLISYRGVRRITAKVKTVICEQAPNHGSYFAYAWLIARVTFKLCQHLVQLPAKVGFGHGTAEGYSGLSIFEHDEMRNAYHTVLLRDRHVVIHVEFADLHLTGISFGTFLHHRSHHLAGTAPVSVEVYQDGKLRLQNLLFKICSSKSVFHNDPSFPG